MPRYRKHIHADMLTMLPGMADGRGGGSGRRCTPKPEACPIRHTLPALPRPTPCHAVPCHAPHDTPEAETRKIATIATMKHTPAANRARQLAPSRDHTAAFTAACQCSRMRTPPAMMQRHECRGKHQRCPRTLRAQDAYASRPHNVDTRYHPLDP